MKRVIVGFITDFRYRKISSIATVNDLLKEFVRKTIHICASFVPLLAACNFNWTVMALTAGIFFYAYCEYRRMTGTVIPVITRITVYAARTRDEGGFVLGPITLGVGVLAALLLFPPEAAKIGIFSLAFGDGVSSLAGKLFGKVKIPLMKGKTLEGSLACFIAVFISTYMVRQSLWLSFSVALLSTIIEMLPIRDYDNILLPVIVSLFVVLLP